MTRVSIVAHSLGTAILFDILRRETLSNPPTSVFFMGGNLGPYSKVLDEGSDQLRKVFYDPHMMCYNLIHPYDALCYRVEPAIDPGWIGVPCKKIPRVKFKKRWQKMWSTASKLGSQLKKSIAGRAGKAGRGAAEEEEENNKSVWSTLFSSDREDSEDREDSADSEDSEDCEDCEDCADCADEIQEEEGTAKRNDAWFLGSEGEVPLVANDEIQFGGSKCDIECDEYDDCDSDKQAKKEAVQDTIFRRCDYEMLPNEAARTTNGLAHHQALLAHLSYFRDPSVVNFILTQLPIQ